MTGQLPKIRLRIFEMTSAFSKWPPHFGNDLGIFEMASVFPCRPARRARDRRISEIAA
jgi:hypothetical protein